jgi:autotransporter-associated beta strand protein
MKTSINSGFIKHFGMASLSVLVTFASTPAQAADHIWDGGGADGSWLTGLNWDDDPVGVPVFGINSVQTFHSVGAGNLTTFVGTNPNVGTLAFNENATNDVIIRLSNAIVEGAIRNLNFTVDAGSAAIEVDPAAAGNFTIGMYGGSVTLASDLVINHNGTGILSIDRPISEVTPDPGPKSVTKNGSGTLALSAANNFDGGLILNAGTLNINFLNCLGGTNAAPGTFTINGGAIDNTSGATVTISNKANPIVINSDFTFKGTNNLTFSTNPVSLGTAAGTTRTVTVDAGILIFAGGISDGDTATEMVKSGGGTLQLNGANSFTGALVVNSGSFLVGGGASFSGSELIIGGSSGSGTPSLVGENTISLPTVISAANGGAAGTHAPGGTSAGTQTFGSTLEYESGAIFAWQVNPGQAEDPGSDTNNFGLFDQVVANGDPGSVTGGSAVFRIVVAGGFGYTDAFWDTDKSWTVFSGTGAPANLGAVFSSFVGTGLESNGVVTGEGQFTFDGSNLQWTASAAPANLYDIWSAGLANPAFDFDSDDDGIDNGLEWILGGNASQNDSPSVLPVVEGSALTGLTLTFTREEDSISETTLTVEYSSDLSGSWASVVIDQDGGSFEDGIEITIDQVPSPDQVIIQIPASNGPDGTLYARLKAVRN